MKPICYNISIFSQLSGNQRRTFAFASVFNYAVDQRASTDLIKLLLDYGADPSDAPVKTGKGQEGSIREEELKQRLLHVCSAKKGFPFRPQRAKRVGKNE